MTDPIDQVRKRADKLTARIKNTSTIRFNAARRVRRNYQVAQLTVIFLSLWAIAIAYVLATNLTSTWHLNRPLLDTAGVILPVFIVVFSLLEGGENYLRAHQLEMNARSLRELSDQFYAAVAPDELTRSQIIEIIGQFSQLYNDCLERTPINHDDIDHFYQVFSQRRHNLPSWSKGYVINTLYLFFVWLKSQFKRTLYITFWFAPVGLFLVAEIAETTKIAAPL